MNSFAINREHCPKSSGKSKSRHKANKSVNDCGFSENCLKIRVVGKRLTKGSY